MGFTQFSSEVSVLQLSLQEVEKSILFSEQQFKFFKMCTTGQMEPWAGQPVAEGAEFCFAAHVAVFSLLLPSHAMKHTLSHPQKGCRLQLLSHLLCAWLELVTVLTPQHY